MKLKKQIKNWVIKKAGGYTPEEHLVVNPKEMLPVRISQHNIVTVSARVEINADEMGHDLPDEFIKKRLMNRLAEGVFKFAKIEKETENPSCVIYRASVSAVDWSAGHEKESN